MLPDDQEAAYQASQAEWRARMRAVGVALKKVTYEQVAGARWRSKGETTYRVSLEGKAVGYVGLRRRESWRKAGRIRVGLIGLSRDWWSGPDETASQTYSDYAMSRTAATKSLLEHLIEKGQIEVGVDIG
jgi:hypothetical protein